MARQRRTDPLAAAAAGSIAVSEADGLRLLHFGTAWCQGAMRLAAPDELELEYAVRMCAWLPFRDPDGVAGRRLVTLGLGAGSLTRFAHRVLRMQATAVEIDARVIDACRRHFLLPPDGDGLRVVHADAHDYIARPDVAASIDVLQVDAYDAAVERPALDGEAFYGRCRAALRPGGTVVANLVGPATDVPASVAGLRAGLRPAATWQFPPTPAGNVVVVAHTQPPPDDPVLAARAAQVEARWGLPASRWLAMARRSTIG